MSEVTKRAKLRFGWGLVAAIVFGLIGIAILVVFAFGLFGFLFMPSLDKAKENADAKQAKLIAQACETYKLEHGEYPQSLEQLTQKIGNAQPVLEAEFLKPKSKPGGHFGYDPSGPNSGGLTVDVWIDCPSGRRGSWMKD